MALSKEEIENEVIKHSGYTLVSSENYKNMLSTIVVKCPKGHEFNTTVQDVRKDSFKCPICQKTVFELGKNMIVPIKNSNTYRIIAFDQATYKCGMSIWDNGKLVYYDLFQYKDYDLIARLTHIRQLLVNTVIPIWKPDLLTFEDIQEQHNGVKTYKILAMLLGICENAAYEAKIPYEDVAPVVWRKSIGTVSGGRSAEKIWAVKKVHELTGLNINEDSAEAILIGYSQTLKHKNKNLF